MNVNFTPFEEKLLEESAEALFGIIKTVFTSFFKNIKDYTSIRKATKNYLDHYIMRNGYIKVLGMSEPIPVTSLYTTVKIISPDYLMSFISIDEIEKIYKETKIRSFVLDTEKREDGLSTANIYQFLNVLGAPGSGKSTFLRKIGLEALLSQSNPKQEPVLLGSNNRYIHKCIPVLVELRRLTIDGTLNLEKHIINEFDICGFPESTGFVKKALENGLLLILLDGVDEITSKDLDQVINEIRDFYNKYNNNRFVTSCRTAFYKSFFSPFKDVIIADFDSTQIKGFISNWFGNNKDKELKTAEEFHSLLTSERYESTYELARTPLLLTFLCLIYDNTQKLPSNRSILYKRALEILIEKWSAEKRVHNQQIYRDLHPELETIMLSEIAGPSFVDDKLFFTKEDLLIRIGNYLQRELKAPAELNSELILEALEIQQGILVERANNIYSFSHLTIHEYLTALYFYDGKLIRLIDNYIYDRRWREVFLLIAGFSKADTFLLLLAKQLSGKSKLYKNLVKDIKWIESFTNSYDEYTNLLLGRLAGFHMITIIKRAFFQFQHAINNDNISNKYIIDHDAIYRKILAYSLDAFDEFILEGDKNVVNAIENLIDSNLIRSQNLTSRFINSDSLTNEHKISIAINSLDLICEALGPWKNTKIFRGDINDFYNIVQKLKLLQKDSQVLISISYLKDTIFKWMGYEISEDNTYDDMQYINNYIYGINLILDCKKSALSVSNDGWKTVCGYLLTT